MTDDEAKAVARVIANVDGGCATCAGRATRSLQERLPERDWLSAVAAESDGELTRENLEDED